jgi:hypothetical protein
MCCTKSTTRVDIQHTLLPRALRFVLLCCACRALQNLLVMRWANPLFGAWWNRHYVNNVQISFKEDFGTQVRQQLAAGTACILYSVASLQGGSCHARWHCPRQGVLSGSRDKYGTCSGCPLLAVRSWLIVLGCQQEYVVAQTEQGKTCRNSRSSACTAYLWRHGVQYSA